MSGGCVERAMDDLPAAVKDAPPSLPPDEGSCDLIRYIDESGSSSCASSLLGDASDRHLMDDTVSLNHLLDDVGPGQFSIDTLDDITSMSCGYASLDARSDLESSDPKLVSPPSKKRSASLSANVLTDDDARNPSIERQRKLLKPCGELLMRRSLGSEELKIPNLGIHTPSVSLPGSTKVSPISRMNNNHIGDDLSSKCSSHRSYHTSQSSIKSSDNILEDFEPSKRKFFPFGSDAGSFHCSSPVMPPQCSPPPIPTGESSYVTTASSSSVESSSQSNYDKNNHSGKFQKMVGFPNFSRSNHIRPSSTSSSVRDSNSSNDLSPKDVKDDPEEEVSLDSRTEKENALNETNNLVVPLADIDEFSDTKDDHTFDTLESKSEKDEPRIDECVAEESCDEQDVEENDFVKTCLEGKESQDREIVLMDSDVIPDDREIVPEIIIQKSDECDEVEDSLKSGDGRIMDDIVDGNTVGCVGASLKPDYNIKYGEMKEDLDTSEDVVLDLKGCGDENRTLTANITEETELCKVEVNEKVEIKIKVLDEPELVNNEDKSRCKSAAGDTLTNTRSNRVPVDQNTVHISDGKDAREEDSESDRGSSSTPLTPNSKINFPKEAWSPGLEPPPHPLHTSTPAPNALIPSPLVIPPKKPSRSPSPYYDSPQSSLPHQSPNPVQPPYLVIPPVSGTPRIRRSPPPFLNHPSTPSTPNSPSPFLQVPPLTPSSLSSMSSLPDSLSPTPTPAPPHHYISSLRMASMRGTADTGGALVARVAAFLRTQYKSVANRPLKLPWCPKFTLPVSEFSCDVTPLPVPGHHKTSGVAVPGTSVLRNLQQVGGVEGRPGRVLVECGRCCYARTALPFSLAYRWATDAKEHHLHHYSVVFVLTLRDFKGDSLFQHLCKEVLPKHILSKEAMNTFWNYLQKIEDKVLFLLVGWDELSDSEGEDLRELVEGRLLPGCAVLLTSRVDAAAGVPAAALNRVYRVTGLPSEGARDLLSSYCSTMAKQDFSEKVLQLVEASPDKYSPLTLCPITCLVLAVLYEDLGWKLPSRLTDLYSALLKHMTRINLLRRGEPMCYDALPEKYIKLFHEFGKLALEAIKSRNPYFSLSDLKTKFQNGQELVDMGLLLRMQSASKHTKKEHYTPLHSCMLEFMAAYYLAGLITSESQLQMELDALAQKIVITRSSSNHYGGLSGVHVVQCLVGLLGRSAHTVINMLAQMAPLQSSCAVLLLRLLRESGRGQENVLEVCKHVSNRDHLEHVIIQSHSADLDDWGRLLYSPDCSLHTLEILLDLDADTRWMADRQDAFFASLAFNESAHNIKLTCVLGGHFGEAEVTRLVSYVRSVLTKRKLEGFELQVTSVLDLEASDGGDKDSDDLAAQNDDTNSKVDAVLLSARDGGVDGQLESETLPAKEGCDTNIPSSCKNDVDPSVDKENYTKDKEDNNFNSMEFPANATESCDSPRVVLRHRSTLERNKSSSKRRSVYDSSSDELEDGIAELESTVCELISKVGNDIGNGLLIEEENEDDFEKEVSNDLSATTATPDVANNVNDAASTVRDAASDGEGTSATRRTVEVLSPVVEMICDTLPELTPTLTRLVLALDLNADQLSRLCSVVASAGQVQVFHLPRLSCGRQGLVALSRLMEAGALKAVNLAGSISSGTPIDERTPAIGGNHSPSPTSEENPFLSSKAKARIRNSVCRPVTDDEDQPSPTARRPNDNTSINFSSKAADQLTVSSSTSVVDASATLPKPSRNKLQPANVRPSKSRPPSTLYTPSQSLLAFWSFTDAEGNRRSVFNSLPRSFYQSLPRRSRHNGCIGGDKRNTDMSTILLQKTSFPPPICCPSLHDNGFHEVLQVLRSPSCRVDQLDLSKCTLGAEDLVCLGETVRYTTCLKSLHMEGLSRVAEIIPVLIGLQSCSSLQLLNLSSPHLLLGDAALQVSLAALGRCAPLKLLVISGWTFQLENERSMASLLQFLTTTQIQHIELAGVRISVSVPDGPLARLGRQDDLAAALTEAVPPLVNDTISFLNMDNVEVSVNGNLSIRGPHLLPLVRAMPRLLDLSLACHLPSNVHPSNPNTANANTLGSPLSNTLSSPLSNTLLKHLSPHIGSAVPPLSPHHDLASPHGPVLQDAQTKTLFATMASAFPSLRRINMSGWSFSWDNCTKVLQACGRSLKASGLQKVVVGAATVRGVKGVGSGGEAEHLLLAMLTSHLHHLERLSIIGMNLTPAQATAFGKSVRDRLLSPYLELDTRGLAYPSVLALRQALVEGHRYELVFKGGPAATYVLKRTDKKDKLLGKWACISTLDR